VSVHAFRMRLKPGQVDEYRRRHDEIWPELADAIRAAGISDYRIFLDPETLALFAILTVGPQDRRGDLPDLPVMRRWWDSMAPLMEVEPGNRPVEVPLTQMFHLP